MHERASSIHIGGASLSLYRSLAAGALHAKLDPNFLASHTFGTPLLQCVQDYYPIPIHDWGRLAPRAVWLVYQLAMYVASRICGGLLPIQPHEGVCSSLHPCPISHFLLVDVRFGLMRRRLLAAIQGILGSYL
jgi:hypothetical protein